MLNYKTTALLKIITAVTLLGQTGYGATLPEKMTEKAPKINTMEVSQGNHAVDFSQVSLNFDREISAKAARISAYPLYRVRVNTFRALLTKPEK